MREQYDDPEWITRRAISNGPGSVYWQSRYYGFAPADRLPVRITYKVGKQERLTEVTGVMIRATDKNMYLRTCNGLITIPHNKITKREVVK